MADNPKFQHRHYKVIADIVSRFPDDIRTIVMREFRDSFMKDNPRFDVGRFEAACNGSPIKRKDKV